jgi:predicted phosphate transport protein (TIGR00153 family)
MRFRFIPREERFFDMFVEDAANVLAAARHLEEMLRTYQDVEQRAKEIYAMEHHGDELSHEIGKRLNTTFITPFDREDIHGLISGLDDILDLIEEVADTFILYNVAAPTPTAISQAAIITRQCELIHEALAKLRGFQGLETYWIEIHRLENEGDRIARAAVASLFDEKVKAIDMVKWKDIYRLLESCIDKCEDVADIIEKICVKHA